MQLKSIIINFALCAVWHLSMRAALVEGVAAAWEAEQQQEQLERAKIEEAARKEEEAKREEAAKREEEARQQEMRLQEQRRLEEAAREELQQQQLQQQQQQQQQQPARKRGRPPKRKAEDSNVCLDQGAGGGRAGKGDSRMPVV